MTIGALLGAGAKLAARYAPRAAKALTKVKSTGGLTGLGSKVSTAIAKRRGVIAASGKGTTGLFGTRPPASLAAAAGQVFKAGAKGGRIGAARAVGMTKELTGIASTQRGLANLAKPGLWSKTKGLAGIGLGALGIKWTKDLLTGTGASAETTATFADDPFQSEHGFPGDPQNPGDYEGNREPLWDAPDILPDFIEDYIEDIDPKLLGYGAAALGLAAAGTGAYLGRDFLGDQWDKLTGKTPKKPKKPGTKKAKGPGKSKNPTFKTLGKEWKRLSKTQKAKYEGEFNAYVKVQKEMRSTVKGGHKKRPNPKPKKGGQQNRMKTAAKKWKSYKGRLSYQEFMSKELRK